MRAVEEEKEDALLLVSDKVYRRRQIRLLSDFLAYLELLFAERGAISRSTELTKRQDNLVFNIRRDLLFFLLVKHNLIPDNNHASTPDNDQAMLEICLRGTSASVENNLHHDLFTLRLNFDFNCFQCEIVAIEKDIINFIRMGEFSLIGSKNFKEALVNISNGNFNALRQTLNKIKSPVVLDLVNGCLRYFFFDPIVHFEGLLNKEVSHCSSEFMQRWHKTRSVWLKQIICLMDDPPDNLDDFRTSLREHYDNDEYAFSAYQEALDRYAEVYAEKEADVANKVVSFLRGIVQDFTEEFAMLEGRCAGIRSDHSSYTEEERESVKARQETKPVYDQLQSLPSEDEKDYNIPDSKLSRWAEVFSPRLTSELWQDRQGDTPLHLAVKRGNSWLVRKLICFCPDWLKIENRAGMTPCDLRVSSGDTISTILDMLFEGCAQCDAAFYNIKELWEYPGIQDLLRLGDWRDIDGNTFLHDAVLLGQSDLVRLFIRTHPEWLFVENEERQTPFNLRDRYNRNIFHLLFEGLQPSDTDLFEVKELWEDSENRFLLDEMAISDGFIETPIELFERVTKDHRDDYQQQRRVLVDFSIGGGLLTHLSEMPNSVENWAVLSVEQEEQKARIAADYRAVRKKLLFHFLRHPNFTKENTWFVKVFLFGTCFCEETKELAKVSYEKTLSKDFNVCRERLLSASQQFATLWDENENRREELQAGLMLVKNGHYIAVEESEDPIQILLSSLVHYQEFDSQVYLSYPMLSASWRREVFNKKSQIWQRTFFHELDCMLAVGSSLTTIEDFERKIEQDLYRVQHCDPAPIEYECAVNKFDHAAKMVVREVAAPRIVSMLSLEFSEDNIKHAIQLLSYKLESADFHDEFGDNPLHYAVFNHDGEAIRLYLQTHPEWLSRENQEHQTPLDIHSRNNKNLVEILFENFSVDDVRLLECDALWQHPQAAELFSDDLIQTLQNKLLEAQAEAQAFQLKLQRVNELFANIAVYLRQLLAETSIDSDGYKVTKARLAALWEAGVSIVESRRRNFSRKEALVQLDSLMHLACMDKHRGFKRWGDPHTRTFHMLEKLRRALSAEPEAGATDIPEPEDGEEEKDVSSQLIVEPGLPEGEGGEKPEIVEDESVLVTKTLVGNIVNQYAQIERQKNNIKRQHCVDELFCDLLKRLTSDLKWTNSSFEKEILRNRIAAIQKCQVHLIEAKTVSSIELAFDELRENVAVKQHRDTLLNAVCRLFCMPRQTKTDREVEALQQDQEKWKRLLTPAMPMVA